MENNYSKMDRRKFISASIGGLLLPSSLFAKTNRNHFIMPPKPFEYYIKEGKQKGGKILIIGGIHGNEEGGYKASNILIDTEIKKGTIAILPRSNPESIFTNMRGYNGDMNRKFSNISPKDNDFYKIKSIKNFIADFKPDIILSLHDGYGFYAKHKNQWGECIVIDEFVYNNLELGKTASFISNQLYKKGFHIPVNNTKTFQKTTHHKEQRKSLTYYALQTHNIPSFCIEASKQTSTKRKLQVHLLALKEFFNLYNVEISPSFDYLLSNIDTYLKPKKTEIIAHINNNKVIVKENSLLKVPKNSEIRFEISNNRGGGLIAKNVNVNYKSFYYRNSLLFEVKSDYLTEYTFKII
jgi:hypothetical protein